MGLLFASASSQGLQNTNCATQLKGANLAHPFTMGCWAHANTFTASSCVAITDTTSASSQYRVGFTGSGIPLLQGGLNSSQVTTAATAGTWVFLLARFISTTSRRLTSLFPGGLLQTSQGTSSTALATTINCAAIGYTPVSTPTNFFDGIVAEAWITNNDPVVGDVITPTEYMYQLAYGGPFSLCPGNVLEYMSLRSWVPPFDAGGPLNEVYSKAPTNALPNWTQVAGPLVIAEHPPLPYWYVRPGEGAQYMII